MSEQYIFKGSKCIKVHLLICFLCVNRLFTDSPELLQLFSFRDIDLSHETARNDKRLTRQARVTMEHLDLAVSSLNDLGSIAPALKELGARHVMYRVEEHHYEVGN